MSAAPVLVETISEFDLIEIEKMLSKLDIAAGLAERENRAARIDPENITRLTEAVYRLIEEWRLEDGRRHDQPADW